MAARSSRDKFPYSRADRVSSQDACIQMSESDPTRGYNGTGCSCSTAPAAATAGPSRADRASRPSRTGARPGPGPAPRARAPRMRNDGAAPTINATLNAAGSARHTPKGAGCHTPPPAACSPNPRPAPQAEAPLAAIMANEPAVGSAPPKVPPNWRARARVLIRRVRRVELLLADDHADGRRRRGRRARRALAQTAAAARASSASPKLTL